MEIIELLKSYGITGWAALVTLVAYFLFRENKTMRNDWHKEVVELQKKQNQEQKEMFEKYLPALEANTAATNKNIETDERVAMAIRWCEKITERGLVKNERED